MISTGAVYFYALMNDSCFYLLLEVTQDEKQYKFIFILLHTCIFLPVGKIVTTVLYSNSCNVSFCSR